MSKTNTKCTNFPHERVDWCLTAFLSSLNSVKSARQLKTFNFYGQKCINNKSPLRSSIKVKSSSSVCMKQHDSVREGKGGGGGTEVSSEWHHLSSMRIPASGRDMRITMLTLTQKWSRMLTGVTGNCKAPPFLHKTLHYSPLENCIAHS